VKRVRGALGIVKRGWQGRGRSGDRCFCYKKEGIFMNGRLEKEEEKELECVKMGK
jgi:hypothetical protein